MFQGPLLSRYSCGDRSMLLLLELGGCVSWPPTCLGSHSATLPIGALVCLRVLSGHRTEGGRIRSLANLKPVTVP